MKQFRCILVFALIILALFQTACASDKNRSSETELAEELQAANDEAIRVDMGQVSMISETEGTVEVIVELPDYAVLFKQAYAADNPDRALINALKSGDYETQQYQITAQVTVEEGKEIFHVNQAVQELLEQEMSQAIQTLMEAELE